MPELSVPQMTDSLNSEDVEELAVGELVENAPEWAMEVFGARSKGLAVN